MIDSAYHQQMVRVLLSAMEEVLGEDGVRSVLQRATGLDGLNTPDLQTSFLDRWEKPLASVPVTRLMESLEQVYGVRAGRGMALRIGRACFQYGLREYGATLGFTDMSFRLLPLPTKLRSAAQALAQFMAQRSDMSLQVHEHDGRLILQIDHCPFCQGRRAQEPICQLAVGLCQESLYWLSGGKMFNVQETVCAARGEAACLIEIDEAPLA